MISQTSLDAVVSVFAGATTSTPVVSNEGIRALLMIPIDSWSDKGNYQAISSKLAAAVTAAETAGLKARTYFGYNAGYDYVELSELPLAPMVADDSVVKRKAICEMYKQGAVAMVRPSGNGAPLYVLQKAGTRYVPVEGTYGLVDGSVVLSLVNPQMV